MKWKFQFILILVMLSKSHIFSLKRNFSEYQTTRPWISYRYPVLSHLSSYSITVIFIFRYYDYVYHYRHIVLTTAHKSCTA